MSRRSRWLAVAPMLAALALMGCSKRHVVAPSHAQWVMGTTEPAFDADGPPDVARDAIARLLSRGLVEEDTAGTVVPVLADQIDIAPDSLVYTFHLRTGLRFTDQTPCTSADVRSALLQGLERPDHSTRRWQLAAVRGVDAIRLGRPLPAIGIDAPDPAILTLRLAAPDPLLLRKLAMPGTGAPWKARTVATWKDAVGLGPYRIATADSTRRLELVRVPAAVPGTRLPAPLPSLTDTVTIRFVPSPWRVRTLLRAGRPDLVWPLPVGMLREPLPAGYRSTTRDAHPSRWLVLVLRADTPPTTRLPARHALVHGINHEDILHDLDVQAAEFDAWMPGAPAFDFPRLDPQAIEQWREAGRLGRSFHVVMTYDEDGPAAEIARGMQGEWATHSIYVELRPLDAAASEHEMLSSPRSQLALADVQDLIDAPAGRLAWFVMPFRGPAVGPVRSGWRTREFDPWVGFPPPRNVQWDPTWAQRRVEEERIVLPLSRMRWCWLERSAGPPALVHPRLGPLPAAPPMASQTR